MKKLFTLLLAVCIVSGCTVVKGPGWTYLSVLQVKGGSLKYNHDTKMIDMRYNTNSDPAIEAAQAGADLYKEGLKDAATPLP